MTQCPGSSTPGAEVASKPVGLLCPPLSLPAHAPAYFVLLLGLHAVAMRRFEVLVNGEVKASGSLLEQLQPPINPPATVPDPTDIKPASWVDEPKWVNGSAGAGLKGDWEWWEAGPKGTGSGGAEAGGRCGADH